MHIDSPHPIPLVILATAWGPKFGGINASNEELTRSLGIKPDRAYEPICVVPRATETEVAEAAHSCSVRLVVLGDVTKDGELPAEMAAHVLQALNLSAQQQSRAVWVGHDDKSGPLAVALRDLCVGSNAVLIHHMAFGAYQDFKKSNSQVANDKREMQRALFKQADLCLAVGPMLQEQLADLLSTVPGAPPVETLVPGLAEPDRDHVSLLDDPPHNFTAFLGGRLGSDDERIKQALLGVRGFGHAVGQAFSGANHQHALRKSPTLRMRGVPDDQHADVRDACTQSASGHNVNFDLQPYTHDRSAYFTALASSSVAMMPSWHEGFGLTAWEAIACRVPVVIGEQSGVYRLLSGLYQGLGLNRSVRAVNVQGRVTEHANEPPHTQADVEAVGNAIHAIGDHLIDAKDDAAQLEKILRRELGFTWTKCALDVIEALQSHLQISLTQQQPINSKVTAPAPEVAAKPNAVPTWLQVPQPRRIQTELGVSPSALLVARDRVVRFDAVRDPLVNDWLNHLHSPTRPHITLRLVTGAGGTGKTRSALELLDRVQQAQPSQTQAWTPLWMPAEVGAALLAEWREFLQTQTAPCLLVVDYAEGRQSALLQWLQAAHELASDASSVNPKLQLHVLCLARTAAWWQELPRSSDCTEDVANLLTGPANLGTMTMPEWPADVRARNATFTAALQDYAAAQGMNTPANAWQPQLDQAPYERPLYIHLAALAALAGERPAHAQALLGAQLKREFEHLCRAEKSLGNTPPRYADWANVMAWLALAQGAPSAELEGALVALKNESAGLGKAIQRACEVESETDEFSLTALQPDLLAEALIVEQVAGRQGAVIMDLALAQRGAADNALVTPRAFEVMARLGMRSELGDFAASASQPRWVEQVFRGLCRAWPQQGQFMVTFAQAIGNHFGQWLLPAWQLLNPRVQQDTAAQLTLPRYSSVLLGLAASVAEANLRAAVTDPARASALNNLSCRLTDQNTVTANARSLSVARESVELYRKLAEKLPATYLPDLAGTLSNFAERLSEKNESGSRAEAVSTANEALLIFRKLVADQRLEFRPNIARTLHNLANVLSRQGGDPALSAALIAVTESVAIYRALEVGSPSKYLPDLAMSLNSLANRLSELSPPLQGAAALDAARESVEIRRGLAEKDRHQYLPALGLSLNSFAMCLFEFGKNEERAESLNLAREAVRIFRTLVGTQRSAYLLSFAASLDTLDSCLLARGDDYAPIETLSVARDSVAIYRELMREQETEYLPHLAAWLINLANRIHKQGVHELQTEALQNARESVFLYVKRDASNAQAPPVPQPDYQFAINSLFRIAAAQRLDGVAEIRQVMNQVRLLKR
jgi:hypothetical protein